MCNSLNSHLSKKNVQKFLVSNRCLKLLKNKRQVHSYVHTHTNRHANRTEGNKNWHIIDCVTQQLVQVLEQQLVRV